MLEMRQRSGHRVTDTAWRAIGFRAPRSIRMYLVARVLQNRHWLVVTHMRTIITWHLDPERRRAHHADKGELRCMFQMVLLS